jgi:hypothetical protein
MPEFGTFRTSRDVRLKSGMRPKADKLADKHLSSTVHCVGNEIIGRLKRREQSSISCFGSPQK